MTKTKQLFEKVENLQSKIIELEQSQKFIIQNLKTRDYLIRTNFLGNLNFSNYKNEFKLCKFGKNNISFDMVCNEIKNYNFDNIIEFLNKLSDFEQKSIIENIDKSNRFTYSNNKTYSTDFNDSNIDNNDTNISNKVVTIQKNNYNKTKKTYKKSNIDKYSYAHPNEYYIENIDKFYRNMYNQKYKLPKNKVIILINAILREKTVDKLLSAMNISRSTLYNYLAILSNIGIIKSPYKPVINLSDDVIIKK